ncbi:MAG TPA: SulP family inorganic anion transporter [Chloroflexia bacterium]|nr:SulP family inorganic anion transporter [Chloroflexia bacterium]
MTVIPALRKYFTSSMPGELRLATLANSLFSGLLIYILEVVFVISFAALVFSGQLAGQLPQALGFIILGNALLMGLMALLSSYPGTIGHVQEMPGVVVGVVATEMVAALPGITTGQLFPTVVIMLTVTTIITGLVFLALGIFKLGGLARFLPYPVMGGFLAGTGWLLVLGGLGIMVPKSLGPEWLEVDSLSHWLPGLVFGLILFAVVSRFNRSITLPMMLVLGTVLFYVVTASLNVSQDQLKVGGWLVGSIPNVSMSSFPLSPGFLSQVNWEVLWNYLPELAPVPLICVISLLLNCGGIELVIKKDIDLNRELVTTGAGNLLAGALGGLAGFHAISLSTLNHKMSGGKRLVGLFAALLMALTVFVGTSVLGYIPRLVLGAVLVYLGVALLVEWVYQAWFKFPKIDFVIILSILVMIVLSGFLNGIILGLILAVIMFVVSYSRLNNVKFSLAGGKYPSRVTRGWRQQQLLETHNDRLFLLKLQGFIFFGTASNIFKRVRELVGSEPASQTRYVLLDFSLVNGLDSTGLQSFSRILQWGQKQKIVLVLTGLQGRIRGQFEHGGFEEQLNSLRFFDDLDHGLEWCENQIIAGATSRETAQTGLLTELKAITGEGSSVEKLLSYMSCREYGAEEYLIRQDDQPDMIYFIESGEVTAQWEGTGQAPVRLETMGGGRLVGELGFYLGIQRTATVIVNKPGIIYSFSRSALDELERSEPEIANLFHRIVVQLLGERVVHLLKVVETLER